MWERRVEVEGAKEFVSWSKVEELGEDRSITCIGVILGRIRVEEGDRWDWGDEMRLVAIDDMGRIESIIPCDEGELGIPRWQNRRRKRSGLEEVMTE